MTLILMMACAVSAFSQKKSELFAEIDNLKSQISEVQQELAKAKREISASKARAEAMEVENASLRDANATLLGNMGNFSQLSKQSSDNVDRAMAALARKERQLSNITNMISTNDSILIAALPRVKYDMGEGAAVGIADGTIVISGKLETLFGSDSGTELSEEGKAWLAKVAKSIQGNPAFTAHVEGLNITGEFGLTYQQISAVSTELSGALGVPAEKIALSARDGNFKEGLNIRLQPDYKGFYAKAKEGSKAAL